MNRSTHLACVLIFAAAVTVMAGDTTDDAQAAMSPAQAPGLDQGAPVVLLDRSPGIDQGLTLYLSGPFVTHWGTGYHGANESWLQSNLDMGTYGFGNQASAGNRVADQFTVPQGEMWQVGGIDFFGYQTGSTTTSTFTSVNLRIWQGTPGAGGTVVWGDTSTNRLVSSWSASTYRVLDTASGVSTDRPIMLLATEFQVTLPPGHYWLDWQADGTLSSGPWAPPITVLGQTTTGSALQSTDGGATWAPLADSGTGTYQGLPFDILGSRLVGNDTCASAQVISCPVGGGTISVVGDGSAANPTGPPSCGGVTPPTWAGDLWYRIPGTGGDITVSTCSSYNPDPYLDTQILVYDGGCSGLGCVAANDDSCAGQNPYLSTVSWSSTSGTDYLVAVVADGDAANYDFELIVDCEASCQQLGTPTVTGVDGAPCGTSTPSNHPMVSWTDVAGESGYHWEVRDAFGVLTRSGATAANVTSADVGPLTTGTYLFRVQATGDGVVTCDGGFSSDCAFEVVPSCQTLPTPAIVSVGGAACGGSTTATSPVLVWSDVDGDSGYRWEVRDQFNHVVKSGTTGQDVASVNVGSLAPGSYSARVQAVGDGVEHCDSLWTPSCSFQVVGPCEPLAVPTVTGVGDAGCGGTTFETSPVLSWSNVEDESGFEWQLRDSSGGVVVSQTTGANVTDVVLGPLEPGSYGVRVRALGDGVDYCDSGWSAWCDFEVVADVGVADFTWWPERPKLGEKVRFADRATGEPTGWWWEMGDGWTSSEENPFHRYDAAGAWDVSMTCQYPGGSDTKIWTVEVEGVIRCGDGLCEGSETAWSCPLDCGLEPEATGRAGGEDRRPSVPAAVGGVAGSGGTFWKTEGWVFNPGSKTVPLILEYTPLTGTEILTAGPFDLEPGSGLYWPNLVEDVFGTTGNGALWVDSPQPVHFLTRSYNESAAGNFGQAVRGLRDKLTLRQGDGKVFLVGLQHDDSFRSNLFFQEVDGFWVTLEVEVFDESGDSLRRSTFDVEGHSNLLRNLGNLGGGGQDSAYVTVEVIDGDGRVNVIGSVVDQVTGDPTTVDPIHLDQLTTKSHGSAAAAVETHHLVAVVAHTKGAANSVWGTRLVATSPAGSADQELRLVYVPEYDRTGVVGDRIERTTTIAGGEQRKWGDVLTDLFDLPGSAKTQGALHVFSEGPLLIKTRTYNRKAGGGSLGQLIKALTAGDLIDSSNPGILVGMSHSPGTRTNIGIAALDDVETEVTLRFFANFPALRSLGSITSTVEPQSHLQIPQVFEALGVTSVALPSVHASVEVNRGGSVYVYASTVDNASGDPTTIEATRK